MSSLAQFFTSWASTIQSSYGVNPWIFIVIYLATLPFTWWLFFLIVFSLKDKKYSKAGYFIVLELILLALPYLYLLIYMQNIHWLIRVAVVILIFWSFVSLRKRLLRKQNDWDDIAKDYDSISNISKAHKEKIGYVSELATKNSPKTILDLGCGSGVIEKKLDEMGYRGEVTSLDSSEEMLKIAKKHSYKNFKPNFIYQDLNAQLPFREEKFDSIIMVNVLFCLRDQKSFLESVNKLLTTDGSFVLVNPKPIPTTANFFSEHFKGLNLVGKIREIGRVIINIPGLIHLLVFQNKLDSQEKNKDSYDYKDKDELATLLKGAGLLVEKVEEIQANQNWLFYCKKA